MYVTWQTIITAGGVLGALTAFVALAWKLFAWVNHQKEQDKEIATLKEKLADEVKDIRSEFTEAINDLRSHHDQDIQNIKSESNATVSAIQEEQTLVVYGLLACLKGLNEQGCDGPVSEAIDKIEKHVNMRAHCQI